MFLWSWAVSWLELCCPHRVTWSHQKSLDASSQSEISSPSSSLPLLVRFNMIQAFMTDLNFVITLHICTIYSVTSPAHHVCFCDAAGFHVFPTFVLYELTILLVLTLSLVIMKVAHFCSFPSHLSPLTLSVHPLSILLLVPFQFVMAVLVLSAILPPGSRHIRWVVSAGLAQVSEFSFVLGSRARRAGIISREVSHDL